VQRSTLAGNEEANAIDLISNEVELKLGGAWTIKYYYNSYSRYLIDLIRQYRNLPNPAVIFFFGDGVSGLSHLFYLIPTVIRLRDFGARHVRSQTRRRLVCKTEKVQGKRSCRLLRPGRNYSHPFFTNFQRLCQSCYRPQSDASSAGKPTSAIQKISIEFKAKIRNTIKCNFASLIHSEL